MRVLVADDDPTYRDLLESLLAKWNFEAAMATDGLEALAVLGKEDAPQLLILDWDMPGVDGFEVTRAVRNDDSGKNAYILIITGSRSKEDLMRLLACGADDYLIKPLDPMDLKIHLRSATRILRLQNEIEELERSFPRGAVGVV